MGTNVSTDSIKQDSYAIKQFLKEAGLDISLTKARDLASKLSGHKNWNTANALAPKTEPTFTWAWHAGFGERKGDAFLHIMKKGDPVPFATIVVRNAAKWSAELKVGKEKDATHICEALNLYEHAVKSMKKMSNSTDEFLPTSGYYGGWNYFWEDESSDSTDESSYPWPGWWVIGPHDNTGTEEMCVILGVNGEPLRGPGGPEGYDAACKASMIVAALEYFSLARSQYARQICPSCRRTYVPWDQCDCVATTAHRSDAG